MKPSAPCTRTARLLMALPLTLALQGAACWGAAQSAGNPNVPASAPVNAPASAQGTGGVLPLVSVGTQWTQNTESYTIHVSAQDAGKPLGLEIYSPALNLLDYADGRRGAGYFGDELYRKNEPFETVYTLSRAGTNNVLLERRYQASREHSWESLFPGSLPAGDYTLSVRSTGDGKNSFALRLAAPFALETSDFSVNARDTTQQDLLAARLTVPAAWVGHILTVQNYDLDGPREARTWVVQPGGKRVDLTTSGDGQRVSDNFTVSAQMVGVWEIYLKVLPTTKQYSNAVQYSFRLDNKPVRAVVGGFANPQGLKLANQLTVEVVDPQGRPIPGASYTVGSDGVVREQLPRGYVPVSAQALSGRANVVSPSELRVAPGDARLRFVARPPQGSLMVDAVAVYGGARIPLPGLPFTVAGQTLTTPASVPLAPGSYPVTGTPVPGAALQPAQPGQVADGAAGRVTLEYRVLTDVTLSTAPDVLEACAVTQLTATARTAFPYRLPSELDLNLPNGWTTASPLRLRGDLSASTPLRLQLPVRVCRSDSAEAVLTPPDVRATGDARVRDPGGVNVTRVVQDGARVRVEKTASQNGAQPGSYLVTLTVTTDSTLDNLRVVDPLPVGVQGPAATRGALSVQGPSLANLTASLDGDAVVLPRLIPGSYTVRYTLSTDLPSDQVLTTPEISWP